MGAFCAFVVGAACGWLAHRYRDRILRVKDRVKAVVDEELS